MRSDITMFEGTSLVTAEELERFPDDDRFRYELVAGRVIRMSPVGYQHGRIVVQVITLLNQHLKREPLGVLVTEVGFKLASNPDTVRGPDIAFLHRDRLPPPHARGFLSHVPDLIVEVMSPDDRPGEFRAKIADYLQRGVPMVVVIDPEQSTVTTRRPTGSPVTLRAADDWLDLSAVIQGFRCQLRDIFE